MSRLIVKNLPKNITEDKLRNTFGQKGVITDIQLKYTKEGVFRQFAFIGYQNEEQADAALKYFNNSCIQTNRIKVELCAPLGAENKPKAWSKYSKESTAYRKKHGIDEIEKAEKEKEKNELKKNKKNIIDDLLGDHKNDPEFIEFMQTHSKNRTLWDNDAIIINESAAETKEDVTNISVKKNLNDNEKRKTITSEKLANEDSGHESHNEDENDLSNEEKKSSIKIAEKEISDLEYMKSLIKTKKDSTKSKLKTSKQALDLYTIKIYNLPYQTKRSDIIKFFKPIKPYSIRLPTKVHGFCYVGFKTEKDFKKAMLKDKSFIKKKQVFFTDFTEKNRITKTKKLSNDQNAWKEEDSRTINQDNSNPKWTKQQESIQNEEDISESGKIFFRNLAYTTTEDDLQKIFEKYGPIAEINLPIDPITRQIKGFGTVTYVMPEHAVKAFSELDGTMFQGRLLHLIPGKSNDKENDQELDENNLGYKAKKALDLKKSANQSHNWNTLFLGANAVVDIISKRLDTKKESIFDETGGYSAAVRLALAETEIVLELKKFLEENGVQLDVFNSTPKKRSKTIILVKNLPAETTITELRPLFDKFGPIGRFLLPPSGVTALIEYMDPSEARKAFQKLAYSKFKNLPLYLEWAPEGTFISKVDAEQTKENTEKQKDNKIKEEEQENKVKVEKGKKTKKSKKEDEIKTVENVENFEKIEKEEEIKTEKPFENTDVDENEPPEPETTIFLRNLNFKTREDTVREHFKHLGPIHIVQVAMKKDPNDPKKKISLGYGFIQFKKRETAHRALKEMQFTKIEGNQVELKRSDRILKSQVKSIPKKALQTKQTGTKILVKNIPFQAKSSEIEDLFKTFGEIRSVRLPKKMTPGENTHRGFGFVDFFTKSDAKKAFEALCQNTHLYGRRLVLEWAAVNDDDNVDELRKRTAEHFTGNTQSSVKRSRKAVFDTTKIDDIQDNVDE